MNVAVFSGHLGRNAELKTVGQHTVTQFSIAVRSGFGDKENTFWVNCAAWNRDKIAQFLVKGIRVVVSGELSMREFEKKDGTKGTSLDLRVNTIDLPPKSETVSAPASTGGGHEKYAQPEVDQVPF